MKPYVEHAPITTWSGLMDFYESGGGWGEWIFRGHRLYTWELCTSLERALDGYRIDPSQAVRKERGLLRRFKRQFRQFAQHIPAPDDYIEWFSIMQHYGCPTRLLDFSYSFFIGLFFAVADVSEGETCALWAVNRIWLEETFKESAPEHVRTHFPEDPHMKRFPTVRALLNNPTMGVLDINPFDFNERLVIQQGVFVIPLDLSASFMDNLAAMAGSEERARNVMKVPIHCNEEFLREAYLNLHRMNINYAGLFPGIDGFARYLKMLLPLPDGFLTIERERY